MEAVPDQEGSGIAGEPVGKRLLGLMCEEGVESGVESDCDAGMDSDRVDSERV